MKAKGSRKEWTLKRTDAEFGGHYYWEHVDGVLESPIFCVRTLALQWMRNHKAAKRRAKGEAE